MCHLRFMDEQTPQAGSQVPAGRHWPSIVTLILALIYMISPVDAIPDLPVIGWIDDASIMMFASSWFAEKNMGIESVWLKKIFSYGKFVLFLIAAAILSLAALVAFGIFKVWG